MSVLEKGKAPYRHMRVPKGCGSCMRTAAASLIRRRYRRRMTGRPTTAAEETRSGVPEGVQRMPHHRDWGRSGGCSRRSTVQLLYSPPLTRICHFPLWRIHLSSQGPRNKTRWQHVGLPAPPQSDAVLALSPLRCRWSSNESISVESGSPLFARPRGVAIGGHVSGASSASSPCAWVCGWLIRMRQCHWPAWPSLATRCAGVPRLLRANVRHRRQPGNKLEPSGGRGGRRNARGTTTRLFAKTRPVRRDEEAAASRPTQSSRAQTQLSSLAALFKRLPLFRNLALVEAGQQALITPLAILRRYPFVAY